MNREIQLLEKLEKELNLKELQIKALLTITQAINDNIAAEGLFNMYRSFLSWEMGIEKMVLFVRNNENEDWECPTTINVDFSRTKEIIKHVLKHKRLYTLKKEDAEEIQDFDVVIPVRHKDYPIAYALIGGLKDKEDLYNKIQFITTITNIIAVAIENKRLFRKQIDQERLNKEMELASQVQKMLIPNELPISDYFEIHSIYQPHDNIGGDYLDYVKLSEDKYAICIADISGKGVAAALLMANFQAMLQSLIYQFRDLETFVFALNEAVYKITKSDKFITFFIAEIDGREKTMRYINAGHYPPVLYQNGTIKTLKKGTTVIGAFDKLPFINEEKIELSKDAIVFCFTDGLIDLRNEEGNYFGEERINELVVQNKGLKPEDFNNKLMDEINTFKGMQEYVDDIAILTCKIL